MDKTSANRDRILDAAERLFSTRGYADVTVSQVCQASGFPVGSIYHHFTNKYGLLAAVFERSSGLFFESLPAVDDLPGDPLDRLGIFYDAAAHVIGDRVLFMRLMFLLQLQEDKDGTIAPLVHEARRRVRTELIAVIEPVARSCGVPRPTELALELAELTMSFTAGLVVFTDAEAVGIPAGIHRLRQLVLATIREAADPRSTPRQATAEESVAAESPIPHGR
ncbi:TetR/AcrR family transcriptional regulator [Embleya scabrispora]|uniref:TetR/AcrR family transcriptional regulator n=1 Tax=Embleya scabrispora TaxID=159449 RepID=UPI00035C983B|nr:TetR/AcrR family transcriptional regulator [Embleya scabrispora]MYS83906.1 TetR family transcriptional regulator [Streptomyces sp. SID5474]